VYGACLVLDGFFDDFDISCEVIQFEDNALQFTLYLEFWFLLKEYDGASENYCNKRAEGPTHY
jgi:hypothetical protein